MLSGVAAYGGRSIGRQRYAAALPLVGEPEVELGNRGNSEIAQRALEERRDLNVSLSTELKSENASEGGITLGRQETFTS